jgi:hypothetical protein
MSALGQKRTCAAQLAMSALLRIATGKADSRKWACPLYPQKADMCSALADVRFGPKADIAANTEVSHVNLIDDLVDLGEKRR